MVQAELPFGTMFYLACDPKRELYKQLDATDDGMIAVENVATGEVENFIGESEVVIVANPGEKAPLNWSSIFHASTYFFDDAETKLAEIKMPDGSVHLVADIKEVDGRWVLIAR